MHTLVDFNKQTLLIIAPHPDDEILGCTGLIRRTKQAGGKVYVMFLTVGTLTDYSAKGSSTLDERMDEIHRVATFLDYDAWDVAFKGNDYHMHLDTISQKDLIAAIEHENKLSLAHIKPTIIATTRESDYNQDHRACAYAVFAATRPTPKELKPLQPVVLGYESVPTADWADHASPKLNFFVELSPEDLDAKILAMEMYSSQVRTGNHPRASQVLRNHAYERGMLCGVNAAEAYVSYRVLV